MQYGKQLSLTRILCHRPLAHRVPHSISISAEKPSQNTELVRVSDPTHRVFGLQTTPSATKWKYLDFSRKNQLKKGGES